MFPNPQDALPLPPRPNLETIQETRQGSVENLRSWKARADATSRQEDGDRIDSISLLALNWCDRSIPNGGSVPNCHRIRMPGKHLRPLLSGSGRRGQSELPRTGPDHCESFCGELDKEPSRKQW